MLTAFSVTYRIMLVLVLLLSFLAKVIVGAAGHNSGSGVSDYIFIGYCIITIVTLTIYSKVKDRTLKQWFRFLNMLFALTGIFVAAYIVIMMISEGDMILQIVIPLILFSTTGMLLFWALVKDSYN